VDGDSASSTEVYASLLAVRPAVAPRHRRDRIAHQMGQIQPIGGVNEKIEGFFDVCKAKGLTGTQAS